jgi:hypothetical protein
VGAGAVNPPHTYCGMQNNHILEDQPRTEIGRFGTKEHSAPEAQLAGDGPRSRTYDLNVWNRGAYLMEGRPASEQYDEWLLCPYEITGEGAGYGTGKHQEQYNLVLTAEEAEALNLADGEDDNWVDTRFFVADHSHSGIPERVQAWIDGLPWYASDVDAPITKGQRDS